MQAHMRKHRIENTDNYKTEIESSISADEMISEICGNTPKWAVVLRGLRHREGLTQVSIGEMLGIPQGNISQMESGKRPIGKQIAKRLAKLFHTDYHLFL